MSSIEGKTNYYHNATFFEEVTATDTWTKVEFKDHLDEQFDSRHIRIKETGGHAAYISFDPRDVDDATRVIQGSIPASGDLFMQDKRATEMYVMRAGSDDATLEIQTWR